MARHRNPDPTDAKIAAYQAFVAQVYELLKDAGASPLGPLSRWGTITLDGISFQFYPEGGYGLGEDHPSYFRPKVLASTQGGNDYFPRSGDKIGWSHEVTPEEVAAAIIEYCQSRDSYDVRGGRSRLTLRTNPVGMDAMYHALQQPRIPWASFSIDQIKTVAYGAMKNGDNELYDKAVAALARRTR